jgi:hypothetical protein
MPTPISQELDDPALQEEGGDEYEPVNQGEASEKEQNEADSIDTSNFSIPIKFSEEEEESIVNYLEENLPKMKPDSKESDKIRGFFAMYEMAVRKRNYPYENAPSLASSDAYDHMNQWLDQAETAFLMQRTTFVLDREEVDLPEETINRIERTYQKKFFKNIFAEELRPMLFEGGFLGVSVVGVSQDHILDKCFKKLVIRTSDDLSKYITKLTKKQQSEAADKLSKGDIYVCDTEYLEYKNFGPNPRRIDQTKFWYPRNTKKLKEWEIVSEQEFYTKDSLLLLAEQGEFDSEAVQDALETRRISYKLYEKEGEKFKLPPNVRSSVELDSDWRSEMGAIKEQGDSYQEELAIYRVTMLHGIKTKEDPKGLVRSWIQVVYCPAGSCILSATHCLYGLPYRLVRLRPVPYKAMCSGIAHSRYHYNLLDTELKSLFLASVEQEVGAPLLIRKNSSLYASGFRAYPSGVAYVDDVDHDAKFMPFPEKSALSNNAMSMVLGSSPRSNLGQGYSSGRRELLQYQKEQQSTKARINSIAVDLDEVFNLCWKIHCNLSKFNRPNNKVVEFVYDQIPTDTKLYILEDEMQEDFVWTCTATATSLTPDARLQEAMQKYEFFMKQPVSVNSPRLNVAWDQYMADFLGLDERQKQTLLPTDDDFKIMQTQQGAQGGQRPNSPPGATPSPLTNQSAATPFHRPPQAQQQGPRQKADITQGLNQMMQPAEQPNIR